MRGKGMARVILLSVLGLLALTTGVVWANTEAGYGALTGRIVGADGTAFTKGFVAFFDKKGGGPPDESTTKRSPVMVAFIGADGRFATVQFPAGEYYVGAMQRERWIGGPPRPGEKRYSAIDAEGKYVLVTVIAGKTTDVGTIVVREPQHFPERKEYFTVRGRVLDDHAKPVAGAVVVVKKDLDNPKGLFISPETDPDGSYELKLPPGKFFFVARKTLTRAGRPRPGGYMGVLGQTKPMGIGGQFEEPPAYIVGQAGQEYNGVDIFMFPVPIPDVRRQEIEAMVKAKQLDKSSLPAALPLKRKSAPEGVRSTHQPQPASQGGGPKE